MTRPWRQVCEDEVKRAMRYASKALQGAKLLCEESLAEVPKKLPWPAPGVRLLPRELYWLPGRVLGAETGARLGPSGAAGVLSDKLFRQVHTLTVPCGSDLVRQDLDAYVASAVLALPRLDNVVLLVRLHDATAEWERLSDASRKIRDRRKTLTLTLVIDNPSPDKSEPRLAAVGLLTRCREASTPASVVCAFTPENCEYADDLRLWLAESAVTDYAFRIGHHPLLATRAPDRLDGVSFTPTQAFHLVGFFDRLAARGADRRDRRFYYHSLATQLAGGGRRATCVFQTNRAVTVDATGALYYCPVHSPALGNCLERSAHAMFFGNLVVRQRIVSDRCGTCTFDAYGGLPSREKTRRGVALLVGPLRRRAADLSPRTGVRTVSRRSRTPERENPRDWRSVLVTGWYGTETTGDKAILGELVHTLRAYNPGVRVAVTSIDPKVSRQTNMELGLADVDVVELATAPRPGVIEGVDAVVIGGGPLMEARAIESLAAVFRLANERGKARVIFGCGLGPIHSDRARSAIADICRLATSGFYRDPAGREAAGQLGGNPDLGVACDPSLAFLRRWRQNTGLPDRVSTPERSAAPLLLGSLVRAQTREYAHGQDLDHRNAAFAADLGTAYTQVLSRLPEAHLELLAMHMYWRGNDDRLFNRRVLGGMTDSARVRLVREYLDIHSIMARIAACDVTVAMRYHGHLFAMALGVPFLSIDYTGGRGKVGSLLRRIGYRTFVETYDGFAPERASGNLGTLIERRQEVREALLNRTERLVGQLETVYRELWGDGS